MGEATEDEDDVLLRAFRLAERNRLNPLPPRELDSSAGGESVLVVDGCLLREANERNDMDMESIDGLGGNDLFLGETGSCGGNCCRAENCDCCGENRCCCGKKSSGEVGLVEYCDADEES